MDNISILSSMLKNSKDIVFFGGAGVSTESGIPDFRGTFGLFTEKSRQIPAEEILHINFFEENTEHFYEFYRNRLLRKAEPNKAHIKLAELEKSGKISAVITQNIDGLHQAAGSVNVIEMHGSIHRNICTVCKKRSGLEIFGNSGGIPMCGCGGVIRPMVTLYGEELDYSAIQSAVKYISGADMLIVAGTSLQVYPVAGLLGYFRGSSLVVINKTETPLDYRADLIIREPVGETLDKIDV